MFVFIRFRHEYIFSMIRYVTSKNRLLEPLHPCLMPLYYILVGISISFISYNFSSFVSCFLFPLRVLTMSHNFLCLFFFNYISNFLSYLFISSLISRCVLYFCSLYFLPSISHLHISGSFLLFLLYFFLILISLLIFSSNHGFSSSSIMFENLLLIVLTIHCCFATFIIPSYCSRVVLWHRFVFTCAVKLLDVSLFILTCVIYP